MFTMKICHRVVLVLCLCLANAQSNITDDEAISITADAPSDVTFGDDLPETEELLEYDETEDNAEEPEEIVVSKDNVIPLLKTIILAFTHKKDPTYKEFLKSGGKAIFKIAEKKVGDDKHMQSLLHILKKFVENYQVEEMADEEEEVLAELAEGYLKKHRFRLLFPESLLLHQPEMEDFIAKKKELGELEGRQFKLDLSPYLTRITNLTSRMRTRIQEMPIFNNLNLDKIGSTFSNIGSVFDEYIPALRSGAGITDLGISMGSLTALAAAGALISAPFFMRSFGASDRDDENEFDFYDNRRVSTGGLPAQQFIINPGNGQPGMISRPQWMENFREPQVQAYTPRINPNYEEPNSLNSQIRPKEQEEAYNYRDDEAYNKYLNDYNQWLQQYHNAISIQQTPNKDYDEYYKKYKEWYSQYYQEQFGESPPPNQAGVPNAYQEDNSIANLQPPAPSQFQNANVDEAANEREDYDNYAEESQYYENIEEVAIPQKVTQNNPVAPAPPVLEKENSNFQVIHVEEQVNKHPQQASGTRIDQLPQPSALIGNPVPRPISYNNLNYRNVVTSPRPVYKPTQSYEEPQSGPSTESGFRPLGSPPHTLLVFRRRPNEGVAPKAQNPQEIEKSDKKNKFNGFSSVKSVSAFKPPVHALKTSYKTGKEEAIWPATSEATPVNPEDEKLINEVKEEPTTASTTPASRVTGVTSGIFKTTAKPTPKSATTPHAYYKKRYNQSVRVVTSTSVVTSRPFVMNSKSKPAESQKDFKKRKITLTELLQNQNRQVTRTEPKAEAVAAERKIEKRIDEEEKPGEVPSNEVEPKIFSPEEDVPVYALDPFYGPRLSRTDAIFHQLSLTDESCREQVVCNMYKNPNAYTPLSDFLSRQLTVTYEQLKRPAVNDERVLRFFKYLQAARAGQDGFDCLEKYPKCSTDTTRLSYKPIVNAYKKVSVLMNASGTT